jgi:hypothetical protein
VPICDLGNSEEARRGAPKWTSAFKGRLEVGVAERFIPVEAPLHTRPLSRREAAFVTRRNALEIIPALAYRQPIVSGKMLIRWHMLADPEGLKRLSSTM